MSDFCENCNPHSSYIIPPPLVNIWLIFDLQKYVKWLCMFLEVNPCFQKAHLFCMDLQPAADPYNVVCSLVSRPPALFMSMRRPMQGPSCSKSQLKSKCFIAKFGSFLDHSEIGDKGQNVISSFVQHPISLIFAIHVSFIIPLPMMWILLPKPVQKSVTTVCLHCSFARLKNKHTCMVMCHILGAWIWYIFTHFILFVIPHLPLKWILLLQVWCHLNEKLMHFAKIWKETTELILLLIKLC